jgi:hypothetical protein
MSLSHDILHTYMVQRSLLHAAAFQDYCMPLLDWHLKFRVCWTERLSGFWTAIDKRQIKFEYVVRELIYSLF